MQKKIQIITTLLFLSLSIVSCTSSPSAPTPLSPPEDFLKLDVLVDYGPVIYEIFVNVGEIADSMSKDKKEWENPEENQWVLNITGAGDAKKQAKEMNFVFKKHTQGALLYRMTINGKDAPLVELVQTAVNMADGIKKNKKQD